jgi:hypothetical protein
MSDNIPVTTLAETAEYIVWTSDEPDEETIYHVELGSVTLHFFIEEWKEFIQLMDDAAKATPKK